MKTLMQNKPNGASTVNADLVYQSPKTEFSPPSIASLLNSPAPTQTDQSVNQSRSQAPVSSPTDEVCVDDGRGGIRWVKSTSHSDGIHCHQKSPSGLGKCWLSVDHGGHHDTGNGEWWVDQKAPAPAPALVDDDTRKAVLLSFLAAAVNNPVDLAQLKAVELELKVRGLLTTKNVSERRHVLLLDGDAKKFLESFGASNRLLKNTTATDERER